MNNYCTNCGNKLEKNDRKCFRCGTPIVDISNQKKGFSKSKILLTVTLIIITIPIHIVVGTKLKAYYYNTRGPAYIKKYAMPELKQKYGDDIKKIDYVKKNNCLKSYSACGEGSGTREVKNCYIYDYDVTLKNNIESKAYVQMNNGEVKIYDEITYTLISYDILDLYNNMNLAQGKIKFNYLELDDDIEDYYDYDVFNSDGKIEERNLIITIDEDGENILDAKFIKKYQELESNINSLIYNKYDSNIYINLEFYLDDNKYINLDNENKVIEVEKAIDNSTSYYSIDLDASDEEIKWCLENSSSSIMYDNYLKENDQ